AGSTPLNVNVVHVSAESVIGALFANRNDPAQYAWIHTTAEATGPEYSFRDPSVVPRQVAVTFGVQSVRSACPPVLSHELSAVHGRFEYAFTASGYGSSCSRLEATRRSEATAKIS